MHSLLWNVAKTMTNQPLHSADSFLETRTLLADDPHRPQYHFLPPANWMNDPNGLIHWRGQYHLFYQHNPHAACHQKIHWGHAVSNDLVYWRDLPIALTPLHDSPDKDGCWSGCAVNNNGVPTLLYSGVQPQVVCVATSDDDMLIWRKYEKNPVIASLPEGIDAGNPWEFRDPFVWREDDGWYLLMGTRIVGFGGAILLYRSHDLVNWEYLHPLMKGDARQLEPFWTGTIWECPNFFKLDGKHVMIVSYQHHETGTLMYPGYYIGEYEGLQFKPDTPQLLEYGAHFYAPQILRDKQDRVVLWGWLWEARTLAAQEAAGWAGVMSLPRILRMGKDGLLDVVPAPELKMLRQEYWHVGGKVVGETAVLLPPNIHSPRLEIMAEVEAGDDAVFGLSLCCSPDGQEMTHLICDRVHGKFTIDREKSSLSQDVYRDVPPSHQVVRAAPLPPGGTIKLHIFLDHSVIEVFLDGRYTLSSRIYPTRPDSLGVQLFCRQGEKVVFKSLDIWTMASIWAGEPASSQQELPTVDDMG